MKREIDDILKQALSPDFTPDTLLNQRIIRQGKENLKMNTNTRINTEATANTGSRPRFRARAAVAAAICCVLALGSITTYATWKLLGAKDVAQQYGDLKLAEAFTGEDAVLVNETQTCGNFRITLLGAVSGENISDYLGQDTISGSGSVYVSGGADLSFISNRLYTVVAIEHADGTPMPTTSDEAYGDETFLASPYVKGLPPQEYNAFTLKGSYSDLVIDGVLYRILETTSVELFADRGVYIGVSDGTFYNQDAFCYDESTGEITRNEDYDGVNALFALPLNPAHANPDAAQAWLDAIGYEARDNASDTSGSAAGNSSDTSSSAADNSSDTSSISPDAPSASADIGSNSSADTAGIGPDSSAVQETASYLPAISLIPEE